MNIFERLAVLDTETTGLDSKTAEICELSAGTYNGMEWAIKSSFFGTKEPIPYTASAKNHISRRMLEGLPLITDSPDVAHEVVSYDDVDYYVAHNARYDQSVMEKAWSDMDLTFDKKWICTLRLVDHVYGNDLELKNLSYLRYRLDLDVPDEVIAHRAKDDVFVTARLFEQIAADAIEQDLIDASKPLPEELWKLSKKPKRLTVWPYGKHKGKRFNEIPTDYYLWCLDNMDSFKESNDLYDSDLVEAVTQELGTRV